MSLAYELSRRGMAAVVVDRQQPGLEASWAGAGILPPGSWYDDHPALAALAALSDRLNVRWSVELAERTGIDNAFRLTGAVHLAETDDQLERLSRKFAAWDQLGIATRRIATNQLYQFEPGIDGARAAAAFYVPGEAQIDNRLHLQALVHACRAAGVAVTHPAEVLSLDAAATRPTRVQTSAGTIEASRVVLAAGAWSGGLGELFGLRLAVKPLRGQMIEFAPLPVGMLRGNVHCGDKYLVPRRDGRLIVGSTVDDVGFDKSTVGNQLAALEVFARELVPGLRDVPLGGGWAGLRPASADGLPYVGRVPGVHNAFVATAHFRAGLQFASGTAVALADLMTGETPAIDLQPLRVDR